MKIPGRDTLVLGGNLLAERLGLFRIEREPDRVRALAREGVLVVACTALGDAIMNTPLLRKLRAFLPGSRLGFMVKDPFAGLFEHHAHGVRVHRYYKKYRREREVVESVRSGGYRVALLSNANDPDVVALLRRAGVRAFLRRPTRDSQYRDWMANLGELRRPEDADYASGHAILQNLAMAEWLGAVVTPEDYTTEVFFTPGDTAEVEARLAGTGPLIVLHPGASRDYKKWPESNFVELIKLLRAPGRRFVLTGSGAERDVAAAITGVAGENVVNLAGELTLRQMAALYARARVMISGDTGPYHLATAVGCPTVTLFAPRDLGSDVGACGPLFDTHSHVALRTGGFGRPVTEITPAQLAVQAGRFLA
ncbi:MAG: glycosyltransferase family 9 protein [Verrucomicrobiae bacterium]|nr:glycosyltransferase family 9 protein [Verrucomicrobiae bacterium]